MDIVNNGDTPTCVRPQGFSVVDMTVVSSWVSTRIRDWCVSTDTETLSDHAYVSFKLSTGFVTTMMSGSGKRWNANKFNKDLFREAIEFRLSCRNSIHDNGIEKVKWLNNTLEMACDLASTRVKSGDRRRSRYW